MYYPVVGERIWVRGCRDEFIVVRTNYSSGNAAIALASNPETVREEVSFCFLFPHEELAGAQAAAGLRQVQAVLRMTHACTHRSQAHISEGLEMVRTTLAAIRRSQTLIFESDRAIARWQGLNCKADRGGRVGSPEGIARQTRTRLDLQLAGLANRLG